MMKKPWKKTIIELAALLALVAVGLGAWSYYRLTRFPRHLVPIADGVLYRCRQPVDKQWHVLEALGIRTVVSLRVREEDPAEFDREKAACREAGVAFVNIPLGYFQPKVSEVERFLRIVRTDPPVLVHCQHGRNRAGQMSAAYRIVEQGWSAEAAYAEWHDHAPTREVRWQKGTRELCKELEAGREDLRARLDLRPTSAPVTSRP